MGGVALVGMGDDFLAGALLSRWAIFVILRCRYCYREDRESNPWL
jgi:hypothetical protein